MKKIFIFLWLCLAVSFGSLQAQLTIRLDAIPVQPADPAIFLAGNFNGWNPGLSNYELKRDVSGKYSITISPAAGNLEFKFTRGSWATVEGNASGGDIANRKFTYNGTPTTLSLTVVSWKGGASSTATSGVVLADGQFLIKTLNRNRRVWVYLPPSYQSHPETRYPVIYMLDGQNLFDAALAFSGEWRVDETLDKLSLDEKREWIVVGIANGESHRIDEYSPWVNAQYGGGEGDLFLQFITDELKPWIDGKYRTLTESSHTAIAGSSMGGLFSFYAGFKRPDIFSKIGAFSSSFWFSPKVYNWLSQLPLKDYKSRVYLTAGTAEGGNQVGDMLRMRDSLLLLGFDPAQLRADADPGKGHNEAYWAEKFPVVLKWLFDQQTSTEDVANDAAPSWFQCTDSTCFYAGPECSTCSIHVSDLSGRRVFSWPLSKGNQFVLPSDANGILVFSLFNKEVPIHAEKKLSRF